VSHIVEIITLTLIIFSPFTSSWWKGSREHPEQALMSVRIRSLHWWRSLWQTC